MRILIVTDAWSPQVNGVVTTVKNTVRELEALGHSVGLITPEGFTTLPCPTYPEIRLALAAGARVARMIEEFEPDAVHLETEAPLGMAARRHCLASGRPFTTAYHTQFPEYVYARCRLPLAISYRWLRWFHGPAEAVLVPTPAIHHRLAARGFTNLAYWSRGVDLSVFAPARTRGARPRTADFSLRGTRRDREEPGRFPAPRPARHEVGRRRWAGTRRARGALSAGRYSTA